MILWVKKETVYASAFCGRQLPSRQDAISVSATVHLHDFDCLVCLISLPCLSASASCLAARLSDISLAGCFFLCCREKQGIFCHQTTSGLSLVHFNSLISIFMTNLFLLQLILIAYFQVIN